MVNITTILVDHAVKAVPAIFAALAKGGLNASGDRPPAASN
jgi:hypothetical protein